MKALFSEQHKQQRQDDTDEYGGGEGEIESEIPFSNDARIFEKSAYTRDFLSNH
jgi:hypothetical protein